MYMYMYIYLGSWPLAPDPLYPDPIEYWKNKDVWPSVPAPPKVLAPYPWDVRFVSVSPPV